VTGAPEPAGRPPRVLLVLMPRVRGDDAGNLLVRMQFAGWPRERLAQIYSSESPGHGDFCGSYHALGAEDRFLGRLFLRLRSRVAGMVAMDGVQPAAGAARPGTLRRWAGRVRKRLGDLIVATGLWEALFPVRPGPALLRFVEAFRPDVVYCTGYSLAFATLPLQIADRFGVPLCFQTQEDWPRYPYARSPVGLLLRRQAARLVRRATLRLAFGETMREAYERRYGVPFHVTYHLDDAARFRGRGGPAPGPRRRVVFTGSLVLNRHEALEDLLAAVRHLDAEGLRLAVDVHCTGVPREASGALRAAPEVRFLPLPPHDALPDVLCGADVLFLPEAFSVGEERLGLALSTKCHLYMMAGRPILVYGPPHAGTVEYARKEGWGLVVDERSVERLADGLRRLLLEPAAGDALTRRATRCFIRNHDVGGARRRFEALVEACAAGGPGGASRHGP